ncbi:hypothetical protein UFOVP185_21 [uncultured Caudovirales phage]|uniref:Uncharacterized protein n=1 Tax=uncultured Caudovirales phage TaxID=2100421 RepID=A0A6J7WNF1_9CAUD|nr:hypothetical protein UFOVP185_21 [uncultured Caudovirales phage]
MKRFNENSATQLVIDTCNNHIKTYGNVLYQPSGFVLNSDKVLDFNLIYSNFTSKLVKTVIDTFGTTDATLKFISRKSTSIMSKCGIIVGGCYIGEDTFTLTYGETSASFIY